MNLSYDNKIAGILAPLFALRREGDLGIGDIAALREFIEWSAEIGFKLVQLLPINEVGGDNSPYNAISSMALEPTTLVLAPGTPADLTNDDYAHIVRNYDLTAWRHGLVPYESVKRLKRALLESAFERFMRRAPSDQSTREFDEFCAREQSWLDDYTFFRALMERHGESEAWDSWQPEVQSRAGAHAWIEAQPDEQQSTFHQRRKFFSYIQWIADLQWREVSEFAAARGVALMGDIPFGVSYYSADVFARPDEFHLDWSGGAPPEPYFKDDFFTMKWGQNWGIPVYNWPQMRRRNFDWWRQRTRGVGRFFHVYRIDHILGFYRIYSFPWRPAENKEYLELEWNAMLEKTNGRAPHFAPRDDDSHDHCEANRREGEEYLRVVLEESGRTRVVGEDLGTVPPYVRPNLQSLGIAGFKIPQWEVYHDRVTPGAEYERVSVATFATHDHKPVRALWEEAFERQSSTREQARDDLRKIAIFSGMTSLHEGMTYATDFYPRAMDALFASNSWLAIVMITDLLARKERFNIPGMANEANWTRRMHSTVADLRRSKTIRERMRMIRVMLEKTGRA